MPHKNKDILTLSKMKNLLPAKCLHQNCERKFQEHKENDTKGSWVGNEEGSSDGKYMGK